jgi:hypothetical protein
MEWGYLNFGSFFSFSLALVVAEMIAELSSFHSSHEAVTALGFDDSFFGAERYRLTCVSMRSPKLS